MRCPFCRTENRDERDNCYYCGKDLSMLRLIVHKARTHFNNALEFAERDRIDEAIRELQNALDLDHSHVNSHVVLGTLYAKRGEMQKAEAAWREAIEVDQRYAKAHGYLDKLATARQSLPLVRRQRLGLVLLTLLALLLLAGVGYLIAPQPGAWEIEAALEAYDSQDYSRALQLLNETQQMDAAGPYQRQALILQNIIRADQQDLLESAQRAAELDRPLDANRLLSRLMRKHPPPTVEAAARQLRKSILDRMRDDIDRLLGQLREGRDVADNIEQRIADYNGLLSNALPGEEVSPALDGFLRRSREEYNDLVRQIALRKATRQFDEENIDRWQYLEQLTQLHRRYPDSEDIAEKYREVAEPLESRWQRLAEENLREGQMVQAGAAIRMLEKFYRITDPSHVDERVSPYLERVDRYRAGRLLEQARQAYGDERLELARAYLAEARGLSGLETERRQEIDKLLERVLAQLARSHWQWLRNNDRAFRQGEIDAGQAQRVNQCLEIVRSHLPRENLDTPVEDALLYYQGLAQHNLGHNQDARESLNQLRRAYPESDYLEPARRLLETEAD